MARVVRASSAAIAAFAIVVAATGWLYVVQPHSALPGPAVADALPLDELSRRSAVPLLVFLCVWLTAAVLLGFVVHAARAERLTAGVILALAVGGWGYVATGMSLLIVRQVPGDQAFHAAAGRQAIYIPAALAGIAGALAGRPRASARARGPLVLACFVAATGLLGLLDAVLPDQRHALIGALAPERVHGVSTALVALLGFVLLVVARGLARRKRRAWQVAVALLCSLVFLHLQHRFGYGAIATSLVAIALLARRSDFDAPGDPESQPRIALRAVLFAGAIVVYGVVAIWVNRVMADQEYTLHFALRETWHAAAGATAGGDPHLADGFGEWFPISVLMLTAAVRDLHAAHSGRFQTDVQTSADEIWLHNPHLTPLSDRLPSLPTAAGLSLEATRHRHPCRPPRSKRSLTRSSASYSPATKRGGTRSVRPRAILRIRTVETHGPSRPSMLSASTPRTACTRSTTATKP